MSQAKKDAFRTGKTSTEKIEHGWRERKRARDVTFSLFINFIKQ